MGLDVRFGGVGRLFGGLTKHARCKLNVRRNPGTGS